MTVLSTNPYQYCPLCGVKLALSELFHFCPFCGKRLQMKEPKCKKKQKKIKAALNDASNSVSGAAADLQSERSKNPGRKINENIPLEAKSATQQINVAAVSAACELADPSLIGNYIKATPFLPALPDENYTVVLKFCPDKDRLFIKLTEILRRDSFAIRLAVELVPAVLMYKSKLAEVLPVLRACRAAGALLSVVSGNFALTVDFPRTVLEQLSVREQRLIKNSPPALWLGETIHFAVGKVASNRKPGLLILSNHHLYFVGAGNQGFEYAMIPLETVSGAERAERKKSSTLVVQQQGKDAETFYATSRHRPIAKLQQLLLSVVALRQTRRETAVY